MKHHAGASGGEVVKVTVTLDPSGRYHVCLHCRSNAEPLPKAGKSVGVDLGRNDVVVTSDGFHSGNPKHLRSDYRQLRRAQQALSRKQKGANNWHRVKGMMQNRSLVRSIAGASWGEIARQLEYKAAWYGRTLTKVDRWVPSSKRCSACGHVVESMPLSVRRWECERCGEQHDRDVNAAKNILAVGHTVNACGHLSKTSPAIQLAGSDG